MTLLYKLDTLLLKQQKKLVVVDKGQRLPKGYQKWIIQKTGNKRHTRRKQTKQKYNTICVGHHQMQTKAEKT